MLKIAVLALLLALVPFDALARDRVINILYTGAIEGELEPCGCSPKSSSGGLARLSGYLSANKDGLGPYLLLDAGNSMGEDTPQGRLKSGVVIDSFAVMGYDAAAFFDDEALAPEGYLIPLVDESGLPALSKTLSYPPSVEVERDSTGINISVDAKAHKKGMLNILLSDRPASGAGYEKGWDIIVLSSGEKLEEPVEADGTVVVSGYPKGEKLGVLTVTLSGDGVLSGFTHRWQTLRTEIAEDAVVRALIDEYDAKVAALLKDEQRPAPSDKTYFGFGSCVDCHRPFVEKWNTTRHSGAFATLERVGKSRDPECVRCHTTGYGEEGGFYSATATPGLANVQCEQCHGPGMEHLSDYAAPMATPAEAVCLRCHTEDNSPDFDYKSYRERIKHW